MGGIAEFNVTSGQASFSLLFFIHIVTVFPHTVQALHISIMKFTVTKGKTNQGIRPFITTVYVYWTTQTNTK